MLLTGDKHCKWVSISTSITYLYTDFCFDEEMFSIEVDMTVRYIDNNLSAHLIIEEFSIL